MLGVSSPVDEFGRNFLINVKNELYFHIKYIPERINEQKIVFFAREVEGRN